MARMGALCASTAVIIVCAAATPAMAQTDPAAPAGAANVDNTGDLDEIVVTAQRRSENLQKVPLSVTAVPPARLEQLNIRSVDQLQTVTPGFVFNTGYTYSMIFIRGVGANFPNAGLEPAVATYIDGAYAQRGFGALYDLLDVDTVQILKGPQGTLYGRNASGGAVLINSTAPTDKLEAHATAEVGNLDHRLLEGVINIPISETLSSRFAARYRDDGGYVHNLATGHDLGGRKSVTARGRLAWEPSPDFKAILTFQYDWNKGSMAPAAERLGTTTTVNNLTGPFAAYNGRPIFTCTGCDATSFPGTQSPVLGFYDTDQSESPIRGRIGTGGRSYFYNLQLEGDLGGVHLRSVTAFRNQRDYGVSDLDFTRALLFHYGQFSGSEAFTQDVTATADITDRLHAVAGASYVHDKGYFDLTFDGIGFRQAAAASPSGALPSGGNVVITNSYSAFGEVTFEPFARLKLTAGGRYTKDKRDITGAFNDTIVSAFGLPATSFDGPSISFNSFTPRFVIAYDAGAVNLYASYNKGFKAGGYSTPALAQPFSAIIVRPEKIESYEIGAKFASPDRKLRANVAAFLYNYRDVQVQVVRLDLGGSIVLNGASARGKGVEADFQYQPVPWLTLFGAASYLHARFRDFPNGAGAGPTGSVAAPVFANVSEDLSGFPLGRSPDFTGNIGATLSGTVATGWKADLTGNVRYSDHYDFSPGAGGPLRTDFQPSFTVADISGNVGPENGAYSIGFFINNLTDEKYLSFRQSAAGFGAFDYVAKPRTYGLRVRASY